MKGLRHLTIWICVMAAMFGMGACSRAEKDEDVRVDMTVPAKDGAGERPVIRLWHIYGSDDDQAARIMEQLTREAEDKFNVTIEVDTAENEGYKTKIKAAAAANELPDIFYTWSHEFLKPMVDAGKVLEVSRYYSDDFQSHLNDAMMKGIQFDGGTYALPLDSSVAMVYYNMEMMDRYGLEIPVTWDEFIQVCQTFVDNGITPMPVGGNEPWTIAMYYDLWRSGRWGRKRLRTRQQSGQTTATRVSWRLPENCVSWWIWGRLRLTRPLRSGRRQRLFSCRVRRLCILTAAGLHPVSTGSHPGWRAR